MSFKENNFVSISFAYITMETAYFYTLMSIILNKVNTFLSSPVFFRHKAY